MRQFDCPQCGAPVVFQSATGEAAICGHCRSMVVRKDVNVEAIGQMAVLPPDLSPLQIGSRGSIDGLGFTLLGRLRVAWDDGSWNEWFVEYADQTRGWVGEAQGFFMVLRETPLQPGQPLPPDKPQAAESLVLNNAVYNVTDAKPVSCLGGEGELLEAVAVGERWNSTDLERDGGLVATLERSARGLRFFTGKNATFEQLSWQNLRAIPGWNGTPLETERNKTDPLSCPNCGGVVSLRAAGLTMTAVCTHCGSVLDTSAPQLKVVQLGAKNRTLKPSIPLGQRGKWEDIEWEMIGFMQRSDSSSPWMEYLLFNPFHGFRWLTEYNGQWTLVDRLLQSPGQSMTYQGRQYRLYADDACTVTYVEGEFYWKVRRGEKARVADFVAPPYILSRETYPELNEVTWSAGEHVEGAKVAQAFGLTTPVKPAPQGEIGGVQPNPYAERWKSLKPVALILGCALVTVHFFTASSGTNAFEQQYEFDRNVPGSSTVVTPVFEIKKQGGVSVEARAGVDNAWLGMDVSLINQATGDTYDSDLSVEYYHGVDADGAWTEGSHTATAKIPAVPPGKYTLSLNVDADRALQRMPYVIKVTGGNIFWSNFFLAGLALLVWPVFVLVRYHSFEKQRWSSSGIKPASAGFLHSDDDGDD